MDINNKARIAWACRRGMRELDLFILPFFHHEYDTLMADEQRAFVKLLNCADPDLYQWLMGYGVSSDPVLQRVVTFIRQRHHARGSVAS